MGLRIGTQLGPYEILSAIGAGGMGEVYRARDTRLNRTVAVKILPDHLSDRAELRERFDREARTVASLNHPHICTLHDIGHQDGTDYLVMEYLEGETLAERLKKGPLPIEQVLKYAIEISDALDKAHRKGVTHRDLKPGNIMITKSGTKLLDFGLAKLKASPPGSPLSQLPTANDTITAQGTILGTLHYMAPEQLEGGEVDARTDIFAFGVVAYEMATGKKAFEGKTSASVMAKILEVDPPPMSSLQPMTPPAFDRVVKTCLAKDPDNRWQAASDLCRELKWIADETAPRIAPVAAASGSKNWLKTALWAGAAVAVCIVVGLVAWYLKPAPARQDARAVRFFVSPPETWSFDDQGGSTVGPAALVVSPDGHQIAFAATSAERKTLLWVRSLDTLTAQSLPGTEGAGRPFWSPDSRFLGFFADGKLKKIDVSGGPPITLCDSGPGLGGTWGRDGVIVFAPGYAGLQRVSASGGVPTAASALGAGEGGHRRPFFLPDGRHFLYYAAGSGTPGGGPIYVSSLDSAERKLLINSDSVNVVYSQGHLLFLRETTLMAQPFDTRQLTMTGEAFPIAENIQGSSQIQTTNANPPYAFFSASENGVLAYQTGGGAPGSQLVWFDRIGKQIGVLGDSRAYTDLELSPDQKRASVSTSSRAGIDIWLYDLARGLPTRFTFGPGAASRSIWSPDGSRIVFNEFRNGHLDLFQKASSGAGTDEVLLQDNLSKTPMSWSPDGRFILYVSNGTTTGNDLLALPLSGDRKPIPFLQTRFNEFGGQFSPDGRWVAYTSDESGKFEVYVAPFPGPGGKGQISTAGGIYPRWRRDGTEIFYLTPDNTLMAAAVNGKGSSFQVGVVKRLFPTHIVGPRNEYDVSADGQKFLINSVPQQNGAAAAPITVVVNWTAGLKK
jgi:Tol biopolymer transport system component/predicted Ser/Thr protein kinase